MSQRAAHWAADDQLRMLSELIGEKNVVSLPLKNGVGCSVKIGETILGTTLFPGDHMLCMTNETGTTCNKSR